ncbi:MAG: hypothetical protein ABG776_10095, partial [Cyanobacteria bacterium J06555_13]
LPALKRWKTVFVSKLSSSNIESLDYIIARTQLRPRELLQFCKRCVEYADYSLVAKRIDECAIAAAEEHYSEQKTRDLASEYRFQYPHLLDVFEVFRGQKTYYTKEELDYLLLSIAVGDIDVERAATWVLDLDYLEFKQILWKIGFLKALVPHTSHNAAKHRGDYLGHYELPTINLENIEKFRVHPACTQFLHLKE